MVVFGRVVPRTPTGVDSREVDGVVPRNRTIIVQSDTEPRSTSLMESRSNLRAMKGGSLIIVEKSRVGGSTQDTKGQDRTGRQMKECWRRELQWKRANLKNGQEEQTQTKSMQRTQRDPTGSGSEQKSARRKSGR